LLLGVNAVLLALAVALPLWLQQRQLIELDTALERAKSGAEVAQGLRAQIDRLRGASDFLAQHAAQRPATVAVLDELSAALPDSTWLFRFEIKKKQVRLQGTSGSASALIGILEESPRFEGASFSSPVVREGSSGKERFNLTASLLARAPQPDDRPLSPGAAFDSLTDTGSMLQEEADSAGESLPDAGAPDVEMDLLEPDDLDSSDLDLEELDLEELDLEELESEELDPSGLVPSAEG
ncbi:MAG: PilN domain-containing protein, partial [Gammaproteobacteria bacterium]